MKSVWFAWGVAVAAASSLAVSTGQTVPRLKPGLWAMRVHSSAGRDNTALPSTASRRSSTSSAGEGRCSL